MSTATDPLAPAPGLHKNIPFADYALWRAINNSTLGRFETSAREAHYYMMHGTEDTDALKLGHFTHTIILEPGNVATHYCRSPKFDRRTNAGKAAYAEFLAANADKCTVDGDEWEQGEALARAAQEHPLAARLLNSPGQNELSAAWMRDGLLCKARMDRFTNFEGYGTIVDLKTTRHAPTARNIAAAIAEYGYHRQAAWYLDGLDVLAPANRRFIFIFIQKDPPHDVVCTELSADAIDQGRREYKRAMALLIECRQRGEWPGIASGLQVAALPAWRVEKDFSIQEEEKNVVTTDTV